MSEYRQDVLTEPNPSTTWFGGLVKMWQDVQRYRYLVSNFVRRDLRVKYRNSALGYFWSLLEPLLLSGVYIVLFAIVAGKPNKQYALWVIVGVLGWRFFGTALQNAIGSLTGNEGTINSIYFPRCLFGVASATSQLFMCALNLLVAVPFMIFFRLVPTAYLLMVPLGLLLLWMLAIGLGLGLAPLNVVNRDVGFIAAFVVRAGLYLSPILWTIEMGRGRYSTMDYLLLNPAAVPITMIRNGIRGRPLPVDAHHVVYSVLFCTIAFFLGSMVFQRYEAYVIKKL